MDRSTHWMNRERVTVYPRIIFVLFVLFCIGLGWYWFRSGEYARKPLGDFILFWATSHLALAGHAADAYNTQSFLAAERIPFPTYDQPCLWLYPPSFGLFILPLALLPFGAAYAVFMASTLAGYVAVFRRISAAPMALWCLAGFSGMWINLLFGQNGFMTAALAAAALVALPRRPVVAGVFIGLLTVKPHLAILFPVALIAIGGWSTLATAAVTAATLVGLGTLAFGTATFRAFLSNVEQSRSMLTVSAYPFSKMPTLFSSLRLLGTPVRWAYGAQTIGGALAVYAVWHVWRHSDDWQLRSATLMTATFLVSPYLYNYDLAWIAFPILWIAVNGVEKGWLRGDREVLLAAWLLPLLMAFFVSQIRVVQVGPIVLAALLWVGVRRSLRAGRTEPDGIALMGAWQPTAAGVAAGV